MLSAKAIHKNYGQLEVLKGVDLELDKGEIVSIVGPSGSGKSTLLHILGTLDRADSGTISINNNKINSFNDKQLAAFRNKNIGFVFQFHHLLPEFTAVENVSIPLWIGGKGKKEALDIAANMLSTVGLGHRTENKPSELSGGEQQRVAIARALVN